ncbi:orotidine-5'-phosphate decarboxylase [Echinimonas agarilytica]|uniref:Orotidine 5'-phosphate decarboxylase n=1 Tax=Echinimonas agarilytica TaxID=1215918 RepID=A0AA41W5Z9_9GAMM|nr:orotidine-5'-phosphate decarboxylase [Echinimonas agarilytica]MCM2679355.1 orotidine-5'-phosphate decarboxylase [Echinimonas agarilytica]
MTDSKVIVALDYDDQDRALNFVDSIEPGSCRLKVGKEMFTYFGPSFVRSLVERKFDVFLDLKFHDIPNTVAKAVAASADLGVWMVNVHASGGRGMMEAAKKSLESYGADAPQLIAVTVLTSMSSDDLRDIGWKVEPFEQVRRLASLTQEAGLDGVVCSAREARMLKSRLGKDFVLVTPGIRPIGADAGDQHRIVTPEKAVEDGADYLVIGRPITQAQDPLQVLQQINQSLANI